MTTARKKPSKASRNYIFNLISFLPLVLLLITGIIVLRYHSGTDQEIITLQLNGLQWTKIHRITALVVIPLIAIHLLMHPHWLKQLFRFTIKGKNGGMNLTLFILFTMCALTALLPWLVLDETKLADALRELHSKLGLLLIVFFAIHISNYFKWLINMTRKSFRPTAKKKSGGQIESK